MPESRALGYRALSLCSLFGLLACGGDSRSGNASDDSVVSDSAGVRMVALPSVVRPFSDSLLEVARIVPADSGAGRFGTLFPGSVATNGTDRIYLLDAKDAQIVVFDSIGTPLARWGRRGSGPGEFEYGDGLITSSEGWVGIFDFIRTAQLRFSADGTVLPIINLPRDSAGRATGIKAAGPDAIVYSRLRQGTDSSTTEIVRAAALDTTVLASLTIAVTANVAFESCPIQLRSMQPYFAPLISAVGTSKGVAVQRGAQWRVEWYEDGALRRVWTRPVTSVATTDSLLELELENGFEIRFNDSSCKVPTEEVGRIIGMASTVPALRRIAVAPDGTLWAERFEPRGGVQRVEVVAADGRYLGTVTGRGIPLGFLSGGRVLYSEEDEDTGLTELVVYRVSGAGW